MKLLYIGTAGTDDPTRATFPFLMAKGAIDAGHEAPIILMGEAAALIKDGIAAHVHGVLPTARGTHRVPLRP